MTRQCLCAASVVLVSLAMSACGRAATVSHESSPVADEEASIFALDVPLVDQEGATRRLADFAGHPLVVTMGYTSCTTVCPRVIEDMKAVEASLGSRAPDVRFVLLSLDPIHDSPQTLRRFAADRHLDLARWRLLTASDDGVRDVAAVFGARYTQSASGEIIHSALMVVVDARGVVRRRQVGIGEDSGRALLDAIESVSAAGSK